MPLRCRSDRPTLISETISLGQGGSFTSSVYLADQLSGLTGYTRTSSGLITLNINQSVNSGFTSAVSNTISVNSLGYSKAYSLSTLSGRFVKYTINAVNSASQIEFNMMGTTT